MERAAAHPTFVVCHSEWFRNKMRPHSSVPAKRWAWLKKKFFKKRLNKRRFCGYIWLQQLCANTQLSVFFSVIYVLHYNSIGVIFFFLALIAILLPIQIILTVQWQDRPNMAGRAKSRPLALLKGHHDLELATPFKIMTGKQYIFSQGKMPCLKGFHLINISNETATSFYL